jgi:hypothetical protein
VARAVGWSAAKVSRMENGTRGLYPDDVSALLGFLQAPAKLREELLALVRDGAKPNWIQVGGKLPAAWKQLIDFENVATALHNYEPLLIPGLLQTGDYARAVIAACNSELSETEVDNLVRTRMSRQAILSRFGGPTLDVIIDEMVLRRPIGEPGVMNGQLHHLQNMACRPRIDLRVAPSTVGAYAGLEGPLMIFEFSDQPDLVLMENRSATGLLEEVAVVRSAKIAWQALRSMAMSADESARLIANLAGELT